MNKYKCIEDRQGGDFAVGVIETANGWREIASEWASSDGNYGVCDYLETLKNDKEIINFIDDFWDITLVEEI